MEIRILRGKALFEAYFGGGFAGVGPKLAVNFIDHAEIITRYHEDGCFHNIIHTGTGFFKNGFDIGKHCRVCCSKSSLMILPVAGSSPGVPETNIWLPDITACGNASDMRELLTCCDFFLLA